MTDMINLALKYGGFTSLDKVYLEQVLQQLTPEQQLAFITPPPSVINAYFAELYQKKSPEVATDYFLELSQALELLNDEPSFAETKPFIRLNLSGKSYGFCYETADLARIFPETSEPVTTDLLFEIAQVFPHYLVFENDGNIFMKPAQTEEVVETQSLTPLTDCQKLATGGVKLSGYNQEELVKLAANYSGKQYFQSENRTAMLYIV